MEWHRNENLDRIEATKVMFEDFSEAVSGILVSRFLASAPTITHLSCVHRCLTPHSCACSHLARYVDAKRGQGVHRLDNHLIVPRDATACADLPVNNGNAVAAKRCNNGPVHRALRKRSAPHQATHEIEWWIGPDCMDVERDSKSYPPLFLQ